MVTNKRSLTAIFTVALLVAAGCSNRGMYNNVQTNNLRDCDQYLGQKREECRARFQKSYDDYERERQEVLEGDKP